MPHGSRAFRRLRAGWRPFSPRSICLRIPSRRRASRQSKRSSHSPTQFSVSRLRSELVSRWIAFRKCSLYIFAVAGLLLNKVPRPEEKAALSEAVYHTLKEFSSRGPAAITSRDTRRFETVRSDGTFSAPLIHALSFKGPYSFGLYCKCRGCRVNGGACASRRRDIPHVLIVSQATH